MIDYFAQNRVHQLSLETENPNVLVDIQLKGKRRWHTIGRMKLTAMWSDMPNRYLYQGLASIPGYCKKCHRKIYGRYLRYAITPIAPSSSSGVDSPGQ